MVLFCHIQKLPSTSEKCYWYRNLLDECHECLVLLTGINKKKLYGTWNVFDGSFT